MLLLIHLTMARSTQHLRASPLLHAMTPCWSDNMARNGSMNALGATTRGAASIAFNGAVESCGGQSQVGRTPNPHWMQGSSFFRDKGWASISKHESCASNLIPRHLWAKQKRRRWRKQKGTLKDTKGNHTAAANLAGKYQLPVPEVDQILKTSLMQRNTEPLL